MSSIGRPKGTELFDHFQGYVDKALGEDLFTALDRALSRAKVYAQGVPPDHEDHRYAEGKWTIKEVFQHLNDTERILSYRALRFARHDATELPGFEENDYVPAADVGRRSLSDLSQEHELIRRSTMALFRSFTPAMLLRTGTANGRHISVRALGWSMAGHAMHHLDILEQRYA